MSCNPRRHFCGTSDEKDGSVVRREQWCSLRVEELHEVQWVVVRWHILRSVLVLVCDVLVLAVMWSKWSFMGKDGDVGSWSLPYMSTTSCLLSLVVPSSAQSSAAETSGILSLSLRAHGAPAYYVDERQGWSFFDSETCLVAVPSVVHVDRLARCEARECFVASSWQ